jgi:RNA polymerase sigma-70 factor (ECF subfamily)
MKDALTEPATAESSEKEAITRACRGDAGAFEYLYKAHCRHVYSVCLRMIRNPAEAEDLMQQTFLQVFRKIGTFRGESGFSTWLHRVTVNIVLMHLRRRKRTEVLLEDLDHPGSDNEAPREFGASDTSMFGAIDRLNLRRAIRRLPSGYKRFFLLYDVIGYGHHEIAQRLGCSTGCSKSQLHRARKQLRRLLQGERGMAREADVAAA